MWQVTSCLHPVFPPLPFHFLWSVELSRKCERGQSWCGSRLLDLPSEGCYCVKTPDSRGSASKRPKVLPLPHVLYAFIIPLPLPSCLFSGWRGKEICWQNMTFPVPKFHSVFSIWFLYNVSCFEPADIWCVFFSGPWSQGYRVGVRAVLYMVTCSFPCKLVKKCLKFNGLIIKAIVISCCMFNYCILEKFPSAITADPVGCSSDTGADPRST